MYLSFLRFSQEIKKYSAYILGTALPKHITFCLIQQYFPLLVIT